MSVIPVTTTNFRREVLESEQPVVVDFYADWCGPCKQIAPAFEALSEKWDGEVRFARVDVDTQPEIASGYNISSIPAVLRFEGGEVTHWCIGAKPAYLIEKELRLTKRGVKVEAHGNGGLIARIRGLAHRVE